MSRALKAASLLALAGVGNVVGAYLFFLSTKAQEDRLRRMFPH